MKKIITLTLTLTLTLGLILTAQAQDELYVYRYGGVTDTLKLSEVKGISHSRVDLQGRRHDDFVLMDVTLADGSVRRFPLEALDSVVMQRGGERYRLVRFTGSMSDDGTLRSRRGLRRTSLDGDFSVSSEDGVQFFWETGDNIFIEVDNNGRDADSVVIREGKDVASFFFKNTTISGDSIVVYYPGQSNKGYNHVVVKAAQTQALPNNSEHLGSAGDCGTGVATKNGNVNGNVNGNENGDGYEFVLDHKATYLCFLPYIANDLGRTVLEKITVHSDSAIAGEFMLDTLGIHPLRDTTHTVTLTTGKFVLPRTANQYDCSGYMVIAPQKGSTRLTCEFTVRDTVLQSTGVYTKTVDLARVEPNMVYVVKANCNNYVVDLGLPVKFLNHNMGAFAPEEYGGYYAYGELEDKGSYSDDATSYSLYNTPYAEIANIRLTQYDVAHCRLGGNFSIPTNDEMRLLTDSLADDKWAWTTVNGHTGQLITGKNGNHLFIPAAGYWSGTSALALATDGHYRTSTLLPNGVKRNWRFHISSNKHEVTESDLTLYRGFSIRPVVSAGVQMIDGTMVQVMTDSVQWQVGSANAKLYATQYGLDKSHEAVDFGFLIGTKDDVRACTATKVPATLSVDRRTFSADFGSVEELTEYYFRSYAEVGDSIYHGNILHFGLTYVDLGLPTGTKWANLNLDAANETQSGGYYAWGETEPKSIFTEANHKWYQSGTYLHPDGLYDLQATRYDAVSAKWDGPWMLPTSADIRELLDNCTSPKDVYYNGVRGYLFTSKVVGYTDRSIFIPRAGYCGSSGVTNFTSEHYIPSSTLYEDDNYQAYHFYNGSLKYDWLRYNGKNIRPVFKTNATSKTGKPIYIRILPPKRKYDGSTEYDTLKAVVRGLPDDGTAVGFVWWKKGDEGPKTYEAPVTPDADGYIRTSVRVPTAGCTYCYNVYVNKGNAEYDYAAGMESFFVAVELVDLGLSVCWANVNLGAAHEAASGEFYRWGATVPYLRTKQEYPAARNITPESNYDIITNLWGATYRMPTKEECNELLENTTAVWTTRNGYSGYLLTSKKSGYENRSIFIPAAGYFLSVNGNDNNSAHHYHLNGTTDACYLWSSTVIDADNAYEFYYNGTTSVYGALSSNNKNRGFPVRAVQEKSDYIKTVPIGRCLKDGFEVDTLKLFFGHITSKNVTVGFVISENPNPQVGQSGVEELTIDAPVNGFNSKVVSQREVGKTYYYRAFVHPDGDEYAYGEVMQFRLFEMVDLDLPSGRLWANMDLGAMMPEDNGDYYAWGELQPKNTYTTANYQFYRNDTYIHIGEDIGGTEYDPATMNLSRLWRLPTREECVELCDYCNWTQENVNGVSCYKASSMKHPEKYIYLPKTQLLNGTSWEYGNSGLFMASNLRELSVEHCLYLYGNNHEAGTNNGEYRYKGMTVRPIAAVTDTIVPSVVAHVETEGAQWTFDQPTATLRGNVVVSGTVTGMTNGFIIGTIREVEAVNPKSANVFPANDRDVDGRFTLTYAHDGSTKFFRAYCKVGDKYYFGNLKSITAADLLDVEFDSLGNAFNGTSTVLRIRKVGNPTRSYNDTYKRNEVSMTSQSYGGNNYNFYDFSFNWHDDFQRKLADGHTVESLFMMPSAAPNNNESAAFSCYYNGGSGVGVKNQKLYATFYLDNAYRFIYSNITPVAGQYYHVVGVWNKDEHKLHLYVDGIEAADPLTVGDTFTQPGRLYFTVGGYPYYAAYTNYGWNGTVTFGRVYDAPLTATQVKSLYDNLK